MSVSSQGRDPSENQDVLFERPASEAPSSNDVVLALHTCIPDGERIERDKLFMEAARQLGVSVRTVRRSAAALMDELGVTSRFAAGAAAVRRGWL